MLRFLLEDAPSEDRDQDGINDAVDGRYVDGRFVDESRWFSANFTDEHLGGTTSGSIVQQGGVTLQIQRATASNGIRITTKGGSSVLDETEPGATVEACGSSIRLTGGDEALINCGSVRLEINAGEVELSPAADVLVVVPAAVTVTVREISAGQFEIENSPESTNSLSVIVDSQIMELAVGGTTSFSVRPKKLREIFKPPKTP